MGAKRVREVKKKVEGIKKPKVKPIKKKKLIEGVRGIVRVAEVDLAGEKKIRIALLRVKGIGKSLAGGIPIAAELDPEAMIGSLTDEQLKKLEDVIRNPGKYGIPFHMLNKRLDPLTGEHKHLVASDLTLATKADIDLMRKMRSYKGIRHELGLPVRGQRTRSSFRKGTAMGVSRKGRKKIGAVKKK